MSKYVWRKYCIIMEKHDWKKSCRTPIINVAWIPQDFYAMTFTWIHSDLDSYFSLKIDKLSPSSRNTEAHSAFFKMSKKSWIFWQRDESFRLKVGSDQRKQRLLIESKQKVLIISICSKVMKCISCFDDIYFSVSKDALSVS